MTIKKPLLPIAAVAAAAAGLYIQFGTLNPFLVKSERFCFALGISHGRTFAMFGDAGASGRWDRFENFANRPTGGFNAIGVASFDGDYVNTVESYDLHRNKVLSASAGFWFHNSGSGQKNFYHLEIPSWPMCIVAALASVPVVRKIFKRRQYGFEPIVS